MASITEAPLRASARHGLQLDTALAEQVLVRFIADAISKFGFTRAVVATSGGIDSALTLGLAARALGPENVLALMLPYRTSNPASRRDAETLVQAVGVESQVIDISEAVDGYLDELDGPTTPVRRGNVMARTRMIATYDQSEAFDALVVGTSNKTELLLGYGTLHGDMASAANPIGDLYKTQVRQLAAALNLPAAILGKPPSADLWQGQSDEDELGLQLCGSGRGAVSAHRRVVHGGRDCRGRLRRRVRRGNPPTHPAHPVQATPARDREALRPDDRSGFPLSARLGTLAANDRLRTVPTRYGSSV